MKKKVYDGSFGKGSDFAIKVKYNQIDGRISEAQFSDEKKNPIKVLRQSRS